MKIEKAELWITCKEPLEFLDGKALRGFFGNLYRNRPEFHHHKGNQLIYRHPLIQYNIIKKSALIQGLKEGAYLLKAIPELKQLEIYHKKYAVSKQRLLTIAISFGLTSSTINYRFVTPWIALNQRNYEKYLRIKHNKNLVNDLLCRILIGNIISMCKAVRYVAGSKIEAVLDLKESGKVKLKQGVEMIAFEGKFEVNFKIPDYWGIGKSSTRGYGTVVKE